MQLIESALAFAITLFALSLISSSFVELIHRTFSMREAGLKYMLGQMFDQVLAKYVTPVIEKNVQQKGGKVAELLNQARQGFVERMSSNRVPMGVPPRATPADCDGNSISRFRPRLWNGRDLASLTTKDFMERLGSFAKDGDFDLAEVIKKANQQANDLAKNAGGAAADAADAVLRDIAQKFEAFGTEAKTYFEGRARLLSVGVAIVLAFAAHVDAVDLFRTYLHDPNARAKTIEQTQAVTAQYKAAQEAANALKQVVPEPAESAEAVKAKIDKLEKDWKAAIGNVDRTVKQYQDLGAAIGWTEERIDNATMYKLFWFCGDDFKVGEGSCEKSEKNEKKVTTVLVQFPRNPSVYFFLFLGGLLIGLGGPFWYNVVTGLTNIRSIARDVTGASAAETQAAFAANRPLPPLTSIDAFATSHVAKAVTPAVKP